MTNQIKKILDRLTIVYELDGTPQDMRIPFIDGIDAAAEAIAALPVDRVAAMASLIHPFHADNYDEYHVPDGTLAQTPIVIMWKVGRFAGTARCCCPYSRESQDKNCDHIRAVEMFRAQQ